MTENIPELDGALNRKSGEWTYDFEIYVTDEIQAEQQAVNVLRDDLKKREEELRQNIAVLARKGLPTSWTIKTVGQVYSKRCRCQANASGIAFVKAEPKPIETITTTPPPRDPYVDLAHRSDFKQILSSGILTKEEKRRCLGLPNDVETKTA